MVLTKNFWVCLKTAMATPIIMKQLSSSNLTELCEFVLNQVNIHKELCPDIQMKGKSEKVRGTKIRTRSWKYMLGTCLTHLKY